MSKIFKGTSDELAYFEESTGTYRSVYKSDFLSGLELPGSPPTVDIVRTYKWSGSDWRPQEVSSNQCTRWCKEIAGLLREDES